MSGAPDATPLELKRSRGRRESIEQKVAETAEFFATHGLDAPTTVELPEPEFVPPVVP